MACPHWVRDLRRYWEWLDGLVRDSGGFLVNQSFIEPRAYWESEDPSPDGADWLLLDIPNHLLNFYDGRFLRFEMAIDASLDLVSYVFHYAEVGGDLIWRACMNDHRMTELNSETHVHLSEQLVVASAIVDLEDALAAIHGRRAPGV